MGLKRTLLGVCFTANTVAMPAFARVDMAIEIGVPPPVAMVEVVPATRPGYVWAPGYWAWHGDRHIWIRGRWVLERPGYAWVPKRWVPAGPRWRFEQGHWARPGHGRGHAYGHYKHSR